jgi:iron complex transport system permease protein
MKKHFLNTTSQKLFWLVVFLLLVLGFSVFLGRYPNPGFMPFEKLSTDTLAQKLVLNLRVPRILTALLLGSGLAAAGAVFQMIFTNPLVDPGFLGVSQGAAFGAALCIFLGGAALAIQASAAFFGCAGLVLSYLLARKVHYGGWVLRLILAGIAVSAMFSSALGIVKFVADPMTQLQEITFWLLGGLWSITWKQFITIAPIVLVSLFIMYRMRWRLNLLSLGDETAFSLGLAPTRERALLLVAAVAATSAVISVAGMVSWIGLIIPHISRRIFGADSRFMLPASVLIGGSFAILCDDLGRVLFTSEIPLGIITSLLGAGIFIAIMLTQKVPIQK